MPPPRHPRSLRACGFQLADLKEAGFSLKELKELKRPGNGGADVAFTLQDFMRLGYSCVECKKAGYSLAALRSGYSEEDLKVTPYTTKAELAEDGFWALGWVAYIFFAFLLSAVRATARADAGIDGNPLEDFFAALFAFPAVIAQIQAGSAAEAAAEAASGTLPVSN